MPGWTPNNERRTRIDFHISMSVFNVQGRKSLYGLPVFFVGLSLSFTDDATTLRHCEAPRSTNSFQGLGNHGRTKTKQICSSWSHGQSIRSSLPVGSMEGGNCQAAPISGWHIER